MGRTRHEPGGDPANLKPHPLWYREGGTLLRESILTCPSCGFRFNYRYTPNGSLNAIRALGTRVFRCPRCKQKGGFKLRAQGTDPSVPTYDDTLRGRDYVLLFGPGALGATVALGLRLTSSPPYVNLAIVAPFVGAAVTVVYALSHIRRATIPLATVP